MQHPGNATPAIISGAATIRRRGAVLHVHRHQRQHRVLRQDQAAAAAGQDTGRDIVVLTVCRPAARLIRSAWVQKLDPSHLPHAYANLSSQFRSPDWDPGRAYSYPWQGIAAVIAYNKKALDGVEVKTLSDLLDNPKLKGRVGLLTEMRDTTVWPCSTWTRPRRSSPPTTTTRG
ncbi:hypothetical protein SHIRM173S_02576 [Streptomyces hirsutus]